LTQNPNGKGLKVRRLQNVAATVALMTIGVLGFQAAASAQGSGYPGPVTAASTTSSITVVVHVGGSVTASACGFTPGAATSEGTAGADGCVNFPINGYPLSLSVNGGPKVAAIYGLNAGVVTVTGPGPSGDNSVIVNVDLVPAVATASTPIAFTGADITATIIGGLGLIAMGFLIIVFVRRRGATEVPPAA
jgi:hypothetical protein